MKLKSFAIVRMLIAQFFLGMALNLIGEPQTDWATWHKVIAYIFFIAHIVNALGLIITGYLLWRETSKADSKIKTLAVRGYGALLLAFTGGILTVSVKPLTEWFSFVMATGFILALIFYGQLFLLQKSQLTT